MVFSFVNESRINLIVTKNNTTLIISCQLYLSEQFLTIRGIKIERGGFSISIKINKYNGNGRQYLYWKLDIY